MVKMTKINLLLVILTIIFVLLFFKCNKMFLNYENTDRKDRGPAKGHIS